MVRQGQLGAFSSCMGFPTSLVGRLPIDKALMKEGDRFQGKSFGWGWGGGRYSSSIPSLVGGIERDQGRRGHLPASN